MVKIFSKSQHNTYTSMVPSQIKTSVSECGRSLLFLAKVHHYLQRQLMYFYSENLFKIGIVSYLLTRGETLMLKH